MDEKKAQSGKSRNVFKRLGIAIGGALLVMVGGYFFATSGLFIKRFVLPMLSEQLNAQVTVSEASVGVFSGVSVKDLDVQSDGTTLLKAKSAVFKYSFWNLVSGRVRVSEFTLDSPEVLVIKRADGSTNLDPIKEALRAEQDEEEGESRARDDETPDVLIRNVSLQNALFRFEQTDKLGNKTMMEAAEVMITVDQFGSGISGTLNMSTRLALVAGPAGQAQTSELQADLVAEFKFEFDSDLNPKTIHGSGSMDVTEAKGRLRDIKGLNGSLSLDLAALNLKQLSLVFQRENEALGKISVTGPLDFLEKGEGNVRVEISGIGKSVLNLAGAPFGLSFGNTTITSSMDLTSAFSGEGIGVAGQLKLGAFSVKNASMVTPPIDIAFEYSLKAHSSETVFDIEKFLFTGTQGGNQVLSVILDQQFRLTLPKEGDPEIGDATFTAMLTGLNLGSWSGLTGGRIRGGMVDLAAHVISKDGGNSVSVVLTKKIRNLGLAVGTNVVTGLDTDTELRLSVTNQQELALEILKVDITHQGLELLELQAGGKVNLKDQTVDIGTILNVDLPKALRLNPVEGLDFREGKLSFTGRLASSKSEAGIRQGIDGNLSITDLSGSVAGHMIDRFSIETVLLAAILDQKRLVVEKFQAPISMSGLPAGGVHVTANASLDFHDVSAAIAITNLNENLLRPFLEPLLGGAKLSKAQFDIKLNASMTEDGKKAVQCDLNLNNLQVIDPKAQIPSTPLAVRLNAKGVISGTQVDLLGLILQLTPTERADNELALSGKIDLSDPVAMSANLLLTAKALDLTHYYDLFSNHTSTGSASAISETGPAVIAVSVDSNVEPDPIWLPIKNSRFETRIGRLSLREIEVTNLLATVLLDRQSIRVNPLQLVVNGGSIDGAADIQLDVPGSHYDFRCNIDRVPIWPALVSFSPKIGRVARGEIVANFRVTGVGQTGRSLRQSLNGAFNFQLTNAIIKLTSGGKPTQALPMDDFFSVLKGAGTEILTGALGVVASTFDMPNLTESPITHVATVIEMGDGMIHLRKADVRSSVFKVQASGTIPINDVLTNSPLAIPVDIWLAGNVASSLTLGSGNERFTKLPRFIEIRGTLGAPETFIDKTVTAELIGGALLRNTFRLGGGTVKAAEGMLKDGADGFKDAFGGLFGRKNQAPQQKGNTKTNAPNRNPFELFNLTPKK